MFDGVRRVGAFLVGLATIVGTTIAVLSWPGTVSPPTQSQPPQNPGAKQNLNAASERNTPQASRSPSAGRSPDIGTCLSDLRVTVPCDTAHTYEVFASGSTPCSQPLLVAYLGGVFALDVLGNQIRSERLTVQGGTSCALRSAGGVPVNATARNALTTGRGDVFRGCVDKRREVYVPCSQAHTSEVVYSVTPQSNADVGCLSKAARYMGTDPLRLSDDLRVSLVEGKGRRPECHVDVLGHNVLTSSLRSIGTQALPISSSP